MKFIIFFIFIVYSSFSLSNDKIILKPILLSTTKSVINIPKDSLLLENNKIFPKTHEMISNLKYKYKDMKIVITETKELSSISLFDEYKYIKISPQERNIIITELEQKLFDKLINNNFSNINIKNNYISNKNFKFLQIFGTYKFKEKDFISSMYITGYNRNTIYITFNYPKNINYKILEETILSTFKKY